MSHATWPLASALALWPVCMGLRMRYEGAILTQAFPGRYLEHRRRVGAPAVSGCGERKRGCVSLCPLRLAGRLDIVHRGAFRGAQSEKIRHTEAQS